MRRPVLAAALLPVSLLLAALPAGFLAADDDRPEKADLAAVTRIRDEAFNRSKAQETLSATHASNCTDCPLTSVSVAVGVIERATAA